MNLRNSERLSEVTESLLRLDEQLFHVRLLVQFPPPGCRNRGVWIMCKSEELGRLETLRADLEIERQSLVEHLYDLVPVQAEFFPEPLSEQLKLRVS